MNQLAKSRWILRNLPNIEGSTTSEHLSRYALVEKTGDSECWVGPILKLDANQAQDLTLALSLLVQHKATFQGRIEEILRVHLTSPEQTVPSLASLTGIPESQLEPIVDHYETQLNGPTTFSTKWNQNNRSGRKVQVIFPGEARAILARTYLLESLQALCFPDTEIRQAA
jgi:hypothetical protein